MSDKDQSLDTGNAAQAKPRARKGKNKPMPPPSRGEALAKGVFMGIIISGVTHASNSITRALIRHPIALFSTGAVFGYLAHKYRKEILAIGCRTASESKSFVLRQQENLLDMLAETRQLEHERDKAQ